MRPGEGRDPCWASRTRPLPQHHLRRWHPLFYTTPTDDGAITVTCDLCFASTSCPDPWAAAAEITHHRCDPDSAVADLEGPGPSLNGEQPPALHLLAGRWIASCPVCGFELATATSQARAERRSRHRTCPVCYPLP